MLVVNEPGEERIELVEDGEWDADKRLVNLFKEFLSSPMLSPSSFDARTRRPSLFNRFASSLSSSHKGVWKERERLRRRPLERISASKLPR